jgi:hypothetical protein
MAIPGATEYQALKAFFRAFSARFDNLAQIAPEHHPIFVLEQMEKASPSHARQGLRMALNDCVEQSLGWAPDRVAEIDRDFLAQGLLSLSQVRLQYSRKYASIVKRGRLRNNEELFLVQGILADQSLSISAQERAQLETMSHAFTEKAL